MVSISMELDGTQKMELSMSQSPSNSIPKYLISGYAQQMQTETMRMIEAYMNAPFIKHQLEEEY